MEGGLVDLWKYRTLVRMREEARKEAETLEIEEKVLFHLPAFIVLVMF